jgi:hypothetical protein
VATLASHLDAGRCRFLELVRERERRDQWLECSCARWLAWRCGLLPRAAREHVRVARRLRQLPLIQAACARGELSSSRVRALTRIADPDTEEELLALRRLTAARLERALRALRRLTSEEANDLHDDAFLITFWDEDGSLAIHGRLAPEDGAVLLRALDAARDQLWEGKEGGSAEPPSSAETLVAVAEAALTSAPARAGDERSQLVVHVDAHTLAVDDGGCAHDDEAAVAPETARPLACAGLRGHDERAEHQRSAPIPAPAIANACTSSPRSKRSPPSCTAGESAEHDPRRQKRARLAQLRLTRRRTRSPLGYQRSDSTVSVSVPASAARADGRGARAAAYDTGAAAQRAAATGHHDGARDYFRGHDDSAGTGTRREGVD